MVPTYKARFGFFFRWIYLRGNECFWGCWVLRPIEVLIRPVSCMLSADAYRQSADVPPPPERYEEQSSVLIGPPPWVWWLILSVLAIALLLEFAR